MNKELMIKAARIVLGLIFFVFGLNGFLNLIPQPPLPETALPFIMGLAKSGYFFPVLKVTETICGALLLLNRFVPLVLVILAPIIVNICLFHLFLAPGGLGLPAIILLLEVVLIATFKDKYLGLLES
jgi:uncharacterized membrane protein YphA (DoxX/SURF4 family)